MLELIEQKIEAIRREPEYVRLRYVWGLVAVVMLIVLFVWITNLRENFRNSDPASDIETMREALPERSVSPLEEAEPSLEAVFGEE